MADIIGIVTSIEDDNYQGKDFKKVTLGTGQVLKVKHGRDDALKDKWGLLKVGVATRFIMRDFTKPDGVIIPFVSDIETVEGNLPEAQTPQVTLEQQAEINAAIKPAPAPQELGMWWKELGEAIRAGNIDVDFPNNAVKIRSQYYKKMSEVTGVNFK